MSKLHKFSIGYLSISLLFLIVGLILGIKMEPIWFDRFGSLVVLFGLISEYALLKKELEDLYHSLKGQGASQFGGLGIPDISPSKLHKTLSMLSHAAIIIGTLVWAFGGLLLSLIYTA